MDPVTLAISLLLAAEGMVALVATAYIVRRYSTLSDKAPFLGRLMARDVLVTVGGAPIGFVIVYSLLRYAIPSLGLGPLLPPWGALLIGVPLMFMLLGPIDDAWTWWRESRRTGLNGQPPESLK